MSYPSYSGPLKNPFNDISNEDDEFGDFTSAVTLPSIGNGITDSQANLPGQNRDNSMNITMPTNSVFFNPIPADSDNDDEFGDFCGPITASNPEAPPAVPGPLLDSTSNFMRLEDPVAKYQPNYNIDLDNDLTAVPQLSWLNRKEQESDQEEEFTNFAAAEPITSDLFIDSPPVEIQSVFSTSHQPQPPAHQPAIVDCIFSQADVMESPVMLTEEADSKVDDDFGEFTQAVVSPSIVEDLFSLDTAHIEPVMVLPFSLEHLPTPSLPMEEDEMGPYLTSTVNEPTIETTPQIIWDEPLEPVVETPQINWDEPSIEVAEEPQIDWDRPLDIVNDSLNDDTIKVDGDTKELVEANQEVIEDLVAEPVPEIETVPVEEEQEPEMEEDDGEEFGDFTDFQTASNNVVATSDDDEFDDFEAAPPPLASDSTPSDGRAIEMGSTPENHIQRVLTTLFPVHSPLASETCSDPINPLTHSPGGTLWSYVSQLDSTPALSFSWRHSAAQQRFLHSLHIDNMLQAGNPAYRWASPSSANVSSSISESFSESTAVTLDLDFFLNPSTTSTATAVPASSATESILETIERELLSPSSTSKNRPPLTTQSPAPVRHNQLSDIFEHLHIDAASSPPVVANRQGVVDLLQ